MILSPGPVAEDITVFEDIPFSPNLKSFKDRIHATGYPELEAEVEDFFNTAQKKAVPKAVFRETFIEIPDDETVLAGRVRFSSSLLAVQLRDIHRVFPYIVTCGRELDHLDTSAYDPLLSELWRSSFKSMALEAASAFLSRRMKAQFGIPILSSVNPGSGDSGTWPIEQQKELFSLFGDTEKLVGVQLTGDSLMIPDKTVSGIYFPSEIMYSNCMSCTRKNCPSRRNEPMGLTAP